MKALWIAVALLGPAAGAGTERLGHDLAGDPVSVDFDNVPLLSFVDGVFGDHLGLPFAVTPNVARLEHNRLTMQIDTPIPPWALFDAARHALLQHQVTIEADGTELLLELTPSHPLRAPRLRLMMEGLFDGDDPQARGSTVVVTLEPGDRCMSPTEGQQRFGKPLGAELMAIEGVRSAGSGASAGMAYASASFPPGTRMTTMLDQVEQAVARVADQFPSGAEPRLYLSPFAGNPIQAAVPLACIRSGGAGLIYHGEP